MPKGNGLSMTECNQTSFLFEAHFSRRVEACFDGAAMTTDGGALLLRAVDKKIRLLQRVAACFSDGRDAQRIAHELSEMLAQRIYGLALGYEDLNDHEELRHDALLGLLAGKRELQEPLAGKSTLNRLELAPAEEPHRYHKISYSAEALDELLVEIFLEAQTQPPREIVLDLDVTDTPLHGEQEARFLHGYYGHYCYLPLYIFCGEHLLCARLRPSNQDASAGSVDEVARIVRQMRQRWPQVRIILRADSGFCREELLAWCEKHQAHYVFGLARNPLLRRKIAAAMRQAKKEHQRTGKAARVFAELSYRTRKSWSCTRRDGESHQRTTQLVQRPPEHGNHAREPTAPVLLLAGLRAGACTAQAGPGGNGVGQRAGGNHPPALAEDRRRGVPQCTTHLGALLTRLAVEKSFRRGAPGPERLTPHRRGTKPVRQPLVRGYSAPKCRHYHRGAQNARGKQYQHRSPRPTTAIHSGKTSFSFIW
jgi:hypothetical protein